MRKILAPLRGAALLFALCAGGPLAAQDGDAPASATLAAAAIDPSTIPLPSLAFEPNDEDVRNYRKYFYFHRTETDFATAHADILECDAYARGFARMPWQSANVPYPYAGTMAGAVGGAVGGMVGNALADAIFGSAQRRELRRINMRACMTFKGYRTYGLRKSLWEEFNFEEGLRAEEEDRRTRMLQIQARVASGPTPQIGEMEE